MKKIILSILTILAFSYGEITAQIIGPSTVCMYSAATYSVPTVAATYNWYTTPGGIATISNPSIQNPDITITSGVTQYTLTVITSAPTNTLTTIVTVNSLPVVDPVNNIDACSNTLTSIPPFTATPVGSTITWTNSNINDGIAASGNGDIADFAAGITTMFSITGTISVYATYNGCTSGPQSFSVTVNPLPHVDAGPDVTYCSNNGVIALTPVTPPTGGFYTGTGIVNSSGLFDTQVGAGLYGCMYSYIDGNGCQGDTFVNVFVNWAPTVNAGLDPPPVCQTELVALAGTGTYTSASWSLVGGGLVSNTDTYSFNTSLNQQYVLTGIDGSNGCSEDDTVNVIVNPSTNIAGTASSSFGVFTANAYLLKANATLHMFDTLQTVSLSSNQYTFYGVPAGDYFLKIIADTQSFPNIVPTYYGDVFQWDLAPLISHGCTADFTADINMIEILGTTGTNFLSGNIIEDFGFGLRINGESHNQILAPGGPLKGIDVKLGKNPGGGIQARTMSDTSGYYHFDSIPVGTYTIYVDIPGLPMDSSYHVSLGTTDSLTLLNYYADSNSVYPLFTEVGLKSLVYEKTTVSLFPNPTKQYVKIEFQSQSGGTKIELMNLQGIVLFSKELSGLVNGKHEMQLNLDQLNLSTGVYFIQVKNGNTFVTKKLIVTE